MEVYFRGKYPDWELIRIENSPKEEVAKIFRKSKLFLSFGGPEGFGLPPLEAAFSGCKIIGFDGYAGAEYFKEPVFTKIPFYEHFEFIDKLDQVISTVDDWDIKDREYIEYLKYLYSREKARESILNFYHEIKNLLS
jgi:glycosyltransferase involved in cell wall biosynthesis